MPARSGRSVPASRPAWPDSRPRLKSAGDCAITRSDIGGRSRRTRRTSEIRTHLARFDREVVHVARARILLARQRAPRSCGSRRPLTVTRPLPDRCGISFAVVTSAGIPPATTTDARDVRFRSRAFARARRSSPRSAPRRPEQRAGISPVISSACAVNLLARSAGATAEPRQATRGPSTRTKTPDRDPETPPNSVIFAPRAHGVNVSCAFGREHSLQEAQERNPRPRSCRAALFVPSSVLSRAVPALCGQPTAHEYHRHPDCARLS